MTSISAASAQSYQSPLQKLQDELLSEVKSGAIKSSDQDALSAALTDIDSAMQASRASDQASGTRPSHADLKSKFDDLIASEVSSGKLTSDQATELQGIFKAAFAKGPGGPGRSRRSASGRPAAFGRCVLQRRHLLVFLDIDRRHPEAIPAIIAGVTVGLVIDVLWRNRHDFEQQLGLVLRVADRLPELTFFPSRFLKAAPLQPSFLEREGWLSYFGGGGTGDGVSVDFHPCVEGPMAIDVMTKPHQLIASDRVEGTAVRRPNGDMIGHIERLMIDKVTGKVSYAILSFGGFLGIGANLIPLPWGRLRYNTKFEAYELDIDDEELKRAPSFRPTRILTGAIARRKPSCIAITACRLTGAAFDRSAAQWFHAKYVEHLLHVTGFPRCVSELRRTDMLTKYAVAGLAASALLATVAFAQSPSATTDRATTAAPAAASDTSSFKGSWRASKLVGLNVYNDSNESLGSINDLLTDKSGNIKAVVIGVGGFLGVGEHLVAVPLDKVKFVDEPIAYTGAANAPAHRRRTAPEHDHDQVLRPPRRLPRPKKNPWYPDHAVFSATKDQLKAMSEFKYSTN